MGKDLILQRQNNLSENQFGLRNGRSIADAIRAVVKTATTARRRTVKRTGFCALVSIDIRNAFNTARWKNCIEAMMRKNIPDYQLQQVGDIP